MIFEQYVQIPTTAHSSRKGLDPYVIVWHWTGGWRDAQKVASVDYQRKKNRVSAHFTIGRDGTIVQSVDTDLAAWHAGGGRFMDLRRGSMNAHSIGVEVCNRGFLRDKGRDEERVKRMGGRVYRGRHDNPRSRKEAWEKYTRKQDLAIFDLARVLFQAIPSLKFNTGHEDVLNSFIGNAKGAKLDPGPAFPWRVIKHGDVMRYDYEDLTWIVSG